MSAACSPFEGALVRFRAREPGDIDVMHPWVNHTDIVRYNESRYPVGRERMRFRASPEFSPGFDHARFAVVARDDGRLVGDISLHVPAPEDRGGWVAIMMGERGRGFGTDAMRLICRVGFETMNLHRIELDVVASNARAVHVYEKVGFRHEGRRRACYFWGGKYEDYLIMGLLRDEYDAMRAAEATA